jgi:hypothetical protein
MDNPLGKLRSRLIFFETCVRSSIEQKEAFLKNPLDANGRTIPSESDRDAYARFYETIVVIWTQKTEKKKEEISTIEGIARAIAELAVVKGLPGGDPCWIAHKIFHFAYELNE